MSVKVQPLAGYVVAVAEEAQTKTASGLYLPGNATEKPKIAKVVAVGKNVTEIKVGDRIIHESYSQTEIKVEQETYLIVKEDKILATVN